MKKFIKRKGKELTDLNVLEYYHDKTGIKIFFGINDYGEYEIDLFKKDKTGKWMWKVLYSDPKNICFTIHLIEFEVICKHFLKDHKIARRWFRKTAGNLPYGENTLNDFLLPSGKIQPELFEAKLAYPPITKQDNEIKK